MATRDRVIGIKGGDYKRIDPNSNKRKKGSYY
jgi:hypothetical protein